MTTSEMSPEQIEKDIERTREDLQAGRGRAPGEAQPDPRCQAQRRPPRRVGEPGPRHPHGHRGGGRCQDPGVGGRCRRPDRAAGARGNPIAVGLGAFALGWMVSSLIPTSRTEQRAAGTLRDSDMAASVAQPVADTARTVVEHAGESAKECGPGGRPRGPVGRGVRDREHGIQRQSHGHPASGRRRGPDHAATRQMTALAPAPDGAGARASSRGARAAAPAPDGPGSGPDGPSDCDGRTRTAGVDEAAVGSGLQLPG